MSTTYTPNTGLATPAVNDRGWGPTINGNATLLDGLTALGACAASLHETPSTSLNLAVSAGTFARPDGAVVAYAGTASYAVPANATTLLWLTAAGTLASGAAWPSAPHVRLASVVAGASTITAVFDARVQLMTLAVGTPTIAAGAGAGTSPTVTLLSGSTDRAGTISVATGTSPTASATVATITFGAAYPSVPRNVSVRAVNAAAAALSGTSAVWEDQPTRATASFAIKVGGGGLAASTTYLFGYHVDG